LGESFSKNSFFYEIRMSVFLNIFKKILRIAIFTPGSRSAFSMRDPKPVTSVLVYEPKCGGRGGVAGSQPMSTAVHRSPNKLWRSHSIFNLYIVTIGGGITVTSKKAKILFNDKGKLTVPVNPSSQKTVQHEKHVGRKLCQVRACLYPRYCGRELICTRTTRRCSVPPS
jgi:hypothetical protein